MVVYHGCSINIANNLNHYNKIIPCELIIKNYLIYNEKKILIKNYNNKLSVFFKKY